MFEKFKPDYTFDKYSDVTPEFLQKLGIHALLIDIDNTLAPYEQSEPDERLIKWLNNLRENSIGAALISNNNIERVELFNKNLGLPAYPNSGKPRKKFLLLALTELGVKPSEAAVMGDQLFTDAYAGKRLGLKAIIVPPIKDKTTVFFRFKRSMEKPIMRSYERDKSKNEK